MTLHLVADMDRVAEEIYREWFVRLRFPGHQSAKIAKGLPVGWEMLPLSQLVELNPSERLDQSEEYPFVGMEDLSLTSMFFSPSQLRRGGQGAKVRNRDVLFPRITPSVENGKRGFVMMLKDGEVGFGSTEFIVMREKVLRAEHLYFLMCSSELRKHAELSMTGASGRQRVQEECFSFFLVKTPPPELRAQLSLDYRAALRPNPHSGFPDQILTKVRDLLLPRLMSGKLSVENLDIHFPSGMVEEIDAKPVGTAHA